MRNVFCAGHLNASYSSRSLPTTVPFRTRAVVERQKADDGRLTWFTVLLDAQAQSVYETKCRLIGSNSRTDDLWTLVLPDGDDVFIPHPQDGMLKFTDANSTMKQSLQITPCSSLLQTTHLRALDFSTHQVAICSFPPLTLKCKVMIPCPWFDSSPVYATPMVIRVPMHYCWSLLPSV